MNFLTLKPPGRAAAELPDGARIALTGEAGAAVALGVRADGLKAVDTGAAIRGEVTVVERLGDADYVYFQRALEAGAGRPLRSRRTGPRGRPHRLRASAAGPIFSMPTAWRSPAPPSLAARTADPMRPLIRSSHDASQHHLHHVRRPRLARDLGLWRRAEPHAQYRPPGDRGHAARRDLRDQLDLHAHRAPRSCAAPTTT